MHHHHLTNNSAATKDSHVIQLASILLPISFSICRFAINLLLQLAWQLHCEPHRDRFVAQARCRSARQPFPPPPSRLLRAPG